MHIHFDTPEFDAQLLRTLSYTYDKGADIGECLSTSNLIKSKDTDSWYEKWYETAERIYHEAENSLSNQSFVSARRGFVRASNYYRTAFAFLFGKPVDERLLKAYDKHCLAYTQAAALFSTPVEKINIPYENTTLPGYFYKMDDTEIKRPVLIVNGGYEGTHQESFFIAGAAALERGYHVLCFDGPGQGEMLIKDGISMRYDWEKVITPVVDYIFTRQDVDTHEIILYGSGWGGYLAPRAAAFEHRLTGLIATPGQFDALEAFKRAFPDVLQLLENDPTHQLEKYISQVLTNPLFISKIRAKMWIHGVDSFLDLLRAWKNYHLWGVAEFIQCPTLIMDSENEPLSLGQAHILYEALSCSKDYILFKTEEGAGEHCEAGASSLAQQRVFDWLQKKRN